LLSRQEEAAGEPIGNGNLVGDIIAPFGEMCITEHGNEES
jgi:hypothetical protein